MRTSLGLLVLALALGVTGCGEEHDHDHDHDHDGHSHDGDDHDGHSHDGDDHDGHSHDGDDHDGHSHDGDDHDGHGHGAAVEENVAAALCAGAMAGPAVTAAAADAPAEDVPTLVSASGLYAVQLPSDGVGRVLVTTTTMHGNWRLLLSEGAQVVVEGQPADPLEVAPVEGACERLFATTALLHIHTPATWELTLRGTADSVVTIGWMLAFEGH